jgi:Uma2 family endonuclease
MFEPSSQHHVPDTQADERGRAGDGGDEMSVPLPRRRFTVDEYYRMAETGILAPGERVELIEGEIIRMEAIGSRHAGCVNALTQLLVRGVGDEALVAVQNPVRLSDLSEPQPDVAVLRPRADRYSDSHPGPEDVLLLIEVADTSVGIDRGTKAPLYAVSGIPEYWLVDVRAGEVEVHRESGSSGYGTVTRHRRGEVLRPVAFPGLDVAVAGILPAGVAP